MIRTNELLSVAREGIRILGHPVLRTQAAAFTRGEIRSKEVKELAEEMVAQMQARRGCGLSAPQVGVSKQLVVFEVSEECIRNEGMARDLTKLSMEAVLPTVIFNLSVTPRGSRTSCHRESCLSVPGYSAHVTRPLAVRAEGLDCDGRPVRFDASGWLARILQHEYDHLNGIIYTDRMESDTFAQEEERWLHRPWMPQDIDEGMRPIE